MQAPQQLLLVALVSLAAACGGDGGGVSSDTTDDTSVTGDVGDDTGAVEDTAEVEDTGAVDSVEVDAADTVADTTEADSAGDTTEVDTAMDTTPVCADGALGCPCRTSGDACDDGLACDGDAVCVTAACDAASCDDDNVCTSDSCDPLVGCAHADVDGACEDGDACTVGDTCVEGECSAGTGVRDCDDGFDCTVDSCDPGVGCLHTPDDAQCSDGVDCTNDACIIGSGCVNVIDNSSCDDGNPCTTDTCSATKGCRFNGVDNYTSCTDDSECTAARECLDLGRTTSTCSALGWDPDNYGSGEVCGESNVDPNGDEDDCSGPKTFAEAARICAAAGARLCTDDELAANESRGSGCSYDVEAIWSSTACDGGFLHRAGSTLYAAEHPVGCSAPTETHYVRCCADIVQLAPTTPVCLLTEAQDEPTPCTAEDPTNPCKPTGACDVFGKCVDQVVEGATCVATNPDDPCKPTGLCDAVGACVDQVAEGAECPATDPTDPCKSTASCDATGTCVDTIAVGAECPASDPANSCAAEGECDGAGLCQDVVLSDGEMCVDGDDGTTYDVCSSGVCEGCVGDAADPDDDTALGATIVPGDGVLITANLCNNDVDYYAVDVVEDGGLVVDLGEGVGDVVRACTAGVRVDVLKPDGATVINNDDDNIYGGCPTLSPEIQTSPQLATMSLKDLTAGTYYVRVRGEDGTIRADDYTLRIASAAPGARAAGVTNSSQASPFDLSGEWYWSVQSNDGQDEWYRISVSADAPSLDITVGYYISWGNRATLYDSAGTQLLYVDDSSFWFADSARVIGPKANGLAAGDYLLKVTREGNLYGLSYVMRVHHGAWTTGDEAEPNDTVDQATAVPDGANSMNATLTSGDVDWYTFTVTERATLTATTGIESIAADTLLELYDETGTSQIGQDADSGVGRTSKLRRTLEPGTYTLKVSEDPTGDGHTGSYTLYLVGR